MKFSHKLIKEVKECYRDNTHLHKLAESGNIQLLSGVDPSWGVVSVDLVLKSKSLKELKKHCAIVKRKQLICDMIAKEIVENENKRKP